MRVSRRFLFVLALAATATFQPVAARDSAPSPQVAWRLLDYLAVDYPGAVADGRIVSASEFAEMTEFSASVRERLAGLPPSKDGPELIQEADGLKAAIARKAPATEVADRAHRLGAALLVAYPTPLAPATAPDLTRGAQLYGQQCASCHGATGHADGPIARGLDPQPVAFADVARARLRSTFGLYQVIGQGLDGTSMRSFAELPTQDRWALAFHVGRFAFDDKEAAAGEALWKSDAGVRAKIPDLQTLTQITPAVLAQSIGEAPAREVMAYLRRHPEAVAPRGAGSLSIARAKLSQSVSAYEAGDRTAARELALAAYLDGFEPVEPALTARDGALMTRVEGAMGDFRASLTAGAPSSAVRQKAEHIAALLDAADRALSPEKASAASSFLGALTILLREGMEALLIVVAMIAFLRKAERKDGLPYVHAGWISALAAGALTWAAATYLISISGASRELTEGFGSIVSAVVLISVGVWMHGKGQADAWQAYIRDKLSATLSKTSAWFLFLLAFIVVYREVFETILFYVALWSQGGGQAMLAGAGVAVVLLALIAWALLSFSKRLPTSKFFAYSSILIAILAVVLAGKGVAALQEAGLLDIRPASLVPRIELLGLFPSWEGVFAQLLTLAVIILGFRLGRPRPGVARRA